jgi:metal-responsive CopG/Arc/MetJ family transcriptional regulator
MKARISKEGLVEKFSISLPPELAKTVRDMAAKKCGTCSQVFRDLILAQIAIENKPRKKG